VEGASRRGFPTFCRLRSETHCPCPLEWGQAVDPSAIEKTLKKTFDQGVFIQATETSPGVPSSVKEIAANVFPLPGTIWCGRNIHVVRVELPMDEWKLDGSSARSQKALMLPPGLAFAALSDKAGNL